MKIVCIVGQKKVGKTTLIERLVPLLKARGLRVGTVKRPPHGFEFDLPGKDSCRHFAAGAEASLVYGHGVAATVRRLAGEPAVEQLIAEHLADCDLVLVEGHKSSSLPKLEVFRVGTHPKPLYAGQPEYLAIACDQPLDPSAGSGQALGIPCLPLDDPAVIAAFLLERL
jgi:molybdopterin-guanine dinucleotide biosynthesis protein B